MSSVHLSIRSKLLQDYETGSPVAFQKQPMIAVGLDARAMFFTIGTDGRLWYIRQASESPTGWKQLDLSQELNVAGEVVHIATAQDREGAPLLAVAVRPASAPSQTWFYATRDFSETRVEGEGGRWTRLGTTEAGEVMQLVAGGGKEGQPLLVFTVRTGPATTNYLLNPDPKDANWRTREVPSPVNSRRILAMGIGHLESLERIERVGAVLYTLFDMGNDRTQLILTSLPDFKFYNHEVALGFNPRAMGLVAGAGGDTELLLGHERMFQLGGRGQRSRDPEQVQQDLVPIGPQELPEPASRILGGLTREGRLEAWVLTGRGNLYHSQEAARGEWTSLFHVRRGVGNVNAWRHPCSSYLDVLTVNLDNELCHGFQDPDTGRWQEHRVLVEGEGEGRETQAYSTVLRFTDAEGEPLVDQLVHLRASEFGRFQVNNRSHFLDAKGAALPCRTDEAGKLTVTHAASSLAAPLLRIEASVLEHDLEIDPAAKVKQRLFGMSWDSFRQARLQTRDSGRSESLFHGRDPEALKGAHEALGELRKLHRGLAKGGLRSSVAIECEDPGSHAWRPKGETIEHGLELDSLPEGYRYGLDLRRGMPGDAARGRGLVQGFHAGEVSRSIQTLGSSLSPILRPFADAWDAVRNGVVQVTGIVIEKVASGVEIVVTGLKEAFRFVVRFAEQVWEVVQFVLDQVGAFIEKIVRWLGFFFNWNDVLRTKNAIQSVLRLALREGADNIEQNRRSIVDFFERYRSEVGRSSGAELAARAGSSLGQGLPGGLGNSVFFSPEFTIIFDKFMDGLGRLIPWNPSAPGDPHALAFLQTGPGAAVLSGSLGRQLASLAPEFVGANPETLFDRLVGLLDSAVLDATEGVVLQLLQAVKGLVKTLESVLDYRWQIPLLTWLYENVISPGSRLTLLDLMSLIVAIPSTLIYKLARGRTPVTDRVSNALRGARNLRDLPAAWAAALEPAASSRAFVSALATPGDRTFAAARVVAPRLAPLETAPNATAARAGKGGGLRLETIVETSYILGGISVSASFVYAFINGKQLAGGDNLLSRQGDLIKGCLGVIAAVASTTALSMAAHNVSNAKVKGSLGGAAALAGYQLAVPVRDLFNWRLSLQPPSASRDAQKERLLELKAILGGVNVLGAFLLYLEEAVAVSYADDSEYAAFIRPDDAVFKLFQNGFRGSLQAYALSAANHSNRAATSRFVLGTGMTISSMGLLRLFMSMNRSSMQRDV